MHLQSSSRFKPLVKARSFQSDSTSIEISIPRTCPRATRASDPTRCLQEKTGLHRRYSVGLQMVPSCQSRMKGPTNRSRLPLQCRCQAIGYSVQRGDCFHQCRWFVRDWSRFRTSFPTSESRLVFVARGQRNSR